MSVPPDLRVLCRKLLAASPADLPAQCPILVSHVLRCGEPLSASAEQPGKANTSEGAKLVHSLKTRVHALLTGKDASGRFAGAVLAKAVVDVGGWECLRTTGPWIQGLLSILKKPGPFASKELSVVALTKIYILLQTYPTLVREIATPSVPSFVDACLQLIRSPVPGKPPKSPLNLVEAVVRALSTLIPIYPTTMRPFAIQIRTAIQAYIAPTISDPIAIPRSLKQCSRGLLILLHYTAAKNSNADEWTKLLNSLIQDCHITADQFFRAVRESRDPSSGFVSGEVSYEGEPAGGGDSADELPTWKGLQSGAQRLIGLVETIASFFECPTKLPVTVPLGTISGLVSRLSMVLPPAPGSQDRDSMSFINPNIGRDERDELWSLLPGIHIASLELLSSIVRRLEANIVPVAPEILEDAARMFAANHHIPRVRSVTFSLVQDVLPLVGPSLARITVDSLGAVVHACCEDLLEEAGYLHREKKDDGLSQNAANGSRNKLAVANADLFLTPGGNSARSIPLTPATKLEAAHLKAAEDLLAAFLQHLPQQHVKKADRTLMDRTAILSSNRAAMVSSVLQPYIDHSGRYFANTVPFLARAYPNDVDLEVLRSNLRTAPHYYGNIFAATAPGEDDASDNGDASMSDALASDEHGDGLAVPGTTIGASDVNGAADSRNLIVENNSSLGGFGLPAAFPEHSNPTVDNTDPAQGPASTPAFTPLTLKRKAENSTTSTPKRLDSGTATTIESTQNVGGDSGGGSDDESDDSVMPEVVFDVDDDEDEDDE